MEISRVSSTLTRGHQRVLGRVVGLVTHVTNELLTVGNALFVRVSDPICLVTGKTLAFLRTLSSLLHLLFLHLVGCQGRGGGIFRARKPAARWVRVAVGPASGTAIEPPPPLRPLS